jgi:hypothetical protein
MKKKKTKPLMSPEQRIAQLAASLLAQAPDFESALAELLNTLKPIIHRRWQQEKLEQQLLTPVSQAMASGDPQKVLKAIYSSPSALELLAAMGVAYSTQDPEVEEHEESPVPVTEYQLEPSVN